MRSESVKVDDIDLKLLTLLKSNSRMSYARLADELGLSESAVRKRIGRLRKLGIIKRFTIDYTLPHEVRAIILVKTTPPTPVPEVARKVAEIDGVDVAYEVTGEIDIVAVATKSDISGINDIIDQIRNVEGVVSSNTMIILNDWVKVGLSVK
ncbi:MAG: Lrp/AsnC family transcriptional regulator [Desulfurococcales archaeon]|nr:Lrp/AsnC family transcriptional regulator [Desulfurococcales archaeon]